MDKKVKKRYILAAVLLVLLLLVLLTLVLASDKIPIIQETVPQVNIEINTGEESDFDSAKTQGDQETTEATDPTVNTENPELTVFDKNTKWGRNTEIEIFRTSYDETGEITVLSSNGDKLVAPGTENRYVFNVMNTGNVPISYWLEARVLLKYTVDDEIHYVPLECKFNKHMEHYLLGSDYDWVSMRKLDRLTDGGELSVNYYQKYILDWRWPFEGDDEFDTFLGNLAADEDMEDVIVKVQFIVRASDDPDAFGGLPKTGDMSNIALWMGIFTFSAFSLVLLLFARRKDEEEA